jgi:hypothetical protein
MASEHHHEAGAAMPMPAGRRWTAWRWPSSQLYVAPLDGSIAPQAVTGGVCYCCKTATAGPVNSFYLAWRHVLTTCATSRSRSRDGGKTPRRCG